MKGVLLVCLFAVAVSARPEQYTDKYDGINVDEIISNDRLLIPYLNCVLDEGKCSPEGKELKSHIQEALENYCAKCTDIQKKETEHMIKYLMAEKMEYWNKLKAKYDPKDIYSHKYEEKLKTLH